MRGFNAAACDLPLCLAAGCELGIGLKPSTQGAAKPYVVETEDWDAVANISLLASRDFIALKLQLEAMAAAARCVAQGASPMPSYVEILKCLELSDEAARSVHARWNSPR
jgi:hypothetical protein